MELNTGSLLSILLLILILDLLPSSDSGSLKFLNWGDKCRIGENLKPSEECDLGKGLLCQTYSQGSYCGCKIGGSLTWDKQSGECRRKIANECFYDQVSEEWMALPFNHKCHLRADCIKVNWTAITGRRNTEDKRICQCQGAFVPSKDFSECIDIKNKTPSVASQMDMGFFISIISMVLWRICN